MKTLKIIALGLALATASSSAYAFQEQKSGGTPEAAPASPATPTAPAAKELGLSPDETTVKPATGTEVRIPGLGKLGVLPKMDFGLELLYGAADPGKPAETQQSPSGDQDDLTIRGTIKHRW